MLSLREGRHTRDPPLDGQCDETSGVTAGLWGTDPASEACESERAHRKEPQIQFRILSFVPESLEREVERPAQGVVVLADHETDAFAEEPALQIRTVDEGAATGRLAAAEP